jgi:hypothetical protein
MKDLQAILNAVTTLALTVHDLNILVDVTQKEAAERIAADCLLRSQSGPH